MANVNDDDRETLVFADESEYISRDEDEEEWLATHCLATVQPGGEDPQHCGLERPCPRHEYRDPQPHWSVRNPVERTSIMLGEARDV